MRKIFLRLPFFDAGSGIVHLKRPYNNKIWTTKATVSLYIRLNQILLHANRTFETIRISNKRCPLLFDTNFISINQKTRKNIREKTRQYWRNWLILQRYHFSYIGANAYVNTEKF